MGKNIFLATEFTETTQKILFLLCENLCEFCVLCGLFMSVLVLVWTFGESFL
jgi:hypothetical protein